jgi:hypothetical protein
MTSHLHSGEFPAPTTVVPVSSNCFNSICPSQMFGNSPKNDRCSKNNETWSIARFMSCCAN